MLKRLILTALAAGMLAGVAGWGLQMTVTTPLILGAEVFEQGSVAAGHEHEAGVAPGHDHGAAAWAPEDGIERNAYTLLTAVLLGVGFAFMLSGGFALRGSEVGWRRGLVWGLAGFAAFYVSPSLGLPPEIPGMIAADLVSRQAWWLFATVAAAGGLAMIFFAGHTAWRLAGAALIVLPHVVGAPHPELSPGGPPAELAARFAVASLVTVGLFWLALGGLSGYFFDRFGDDRPV